MFVHCYYNSRTETYFVCTSADEEEAFKKLEEICDERDEDTDDWHYMGTSTQLEAIQMCLHKAEQSLALGKHYKAFYPEIEDANAIAGK